MNPVIFYLYLDMAEVRFSRSQHLKTVFQKKLTSSARRRTVMHSSEQTTVIGWTTIPAETTKITAFNDVACACPLEYCRFTKTTLLEYCEIFMLRIAFHHSDSHYHMPLR